MASMTDFSMSTIKPMTPAWLYAGWKYLADRPEMIKRGWDACGLHSMFDERRAGVVRQAKLAMYDTSHKLYPLFPSNDSAALPPEVAAGEHEPELEPVFQDAEEGAATLEQLVQADPEVVDAELQSGVRAALQAVATQSARRSAAPAGASTGRALFPIFAAARRAAQPNGSSSR
jgi:hypothetical protein